MQLGLNSFRIVFAYALFSIAWIYFSDTLLEWFVKDAQTLSTIQTYKGLFFVLASSLLLYILIKAYIAQFRSIHKRFKENEQRLRHVIQGAQLGYWDWDYRTNKQWVNETWLSFLGLQPDEISDDVKDWSERIHPEDMPLAQKAIEQTIEDGKPYRIEFRMRHKDGHWVWIEGSGSVVSRDEISGQPLRLAGTHRDISERKAFDEKIAFLAHNDPLTALPNRFYLRQIFEAKLLSHEPFAFLFLDLDYFKTINDLYGHSVGDAVIVQSAARFKALLTSSDFIARVGGDEFVLLVPQKDAASCAEALLDALQEPFKVAKEAFVLGASIGIAIGGKDGNTFEELFKKADTAMYAAKSSGKNRYTFYESRMTDVIIQTTQVDRELKEAIERDQFVLYYQPLLDIQSSEVIGAEALVRWMHPERGMVYPGEFIGRAEESGMIVALGDLVMKKAFAQYLQWRESQRFQGVLAVNLSSIEIEQEDFVAKMQAHAAWLGEFVCGIELEITERVIMNDPNASTQTLQKLENSGFKISIDDFGTGYSSLSYLKTLPIHKLKIDRSFIQDLPRDKDDRSIVRAIIALAKNLDLEVLAEGVETREQERFLIENWCDSAQGYFYAKPMCVEDFEAYVRNN